MPFPTSTDCPDAGKLVMYTSDQAYNVVYGVENLSTHMPAVPAPVNDASAEYTYPEYTGDVTIEIVPAVPLFHALKVPLWKL